MALTTSASSSNLGNKPKWYFTDEEILHLPSQKAGMSPSGELRGRREAAEFICDMGEYLNQSMPQNRHNISSWCVFVAIVHMHRFYTVHPITVFTPKEVAAACLFMTGKSEECPRKLEHIVEAWFKLKHRNAEVQPPFNDITRKRGTDLIVYLEQILLQTIGFDLHVTIPHSIILSNKDKLKYENELVNIAYWFATDIIKWTNWPIRYSEQTIACVCIHAASSWANHEIPETTAGTPWFKDIDPNMTEWLLQKLVREFTPVYEQFGARSKNCVRHFIKNAKNGGNPSTMHPMPATFSIAQMPHPMPATNSISRMPHPMPATNSISRMPQIPANSIAQIPRMPASSIAQMPATSSIVQMPQIPVNSSIAYYQLLPPPPPPPVLPQSVKKEPVINDGTPKQHSIHPRQMMILNTR